MIQIGLPVSDKLDKLFPDDPDGDVIITYQGKKYKLHKFPLKIESDYFREQFGGAESHPISHLNITRTDFDSDIFDRLLSVFYKGKVFIPLARLLQAYIITQFLRAPVLMTQIADKILSHFDQFDFYAVYETAVHYDDKLLLSHCRDHLLGTRFQKLSSEVAQEKMRENEELIVKRYDKLHGIAVLNEETFESLLAFHHEQKKVKGPQVSAVPDIDIIKLARIFYCVNGLKTTNPVVQARRVRADDKLREVCKKYINIDSLKSNELSIVLEDVYVSDKPPTKTDILAREVAVLKKQKHELGDLLAEAKLENAREIKRLCLENEELQAKLRDQTKLLQKVEEKVNAAAKANSVIASKPKEPVITEEMVQNRIAAYFAKMSTNETAELKILAKVQDEKIRALEARLNKQEHQNVLQANTGKENQTSGAVSDKHVIALVKSESEAMLPELETRMKGLLWYVPHFLEFDLEPTLIRFKDQKMIRQWLGHLHPESMQLQLKLVFRGTTDSFIAKDFHQKVDKVKGPTIMFARVRQSGGADLRIGGYLSEGWASTNAYHEDAEAFVFSLTTKQKYRCAEPRKSVFHNPKALCYFGTGPDLFIGAKCDVNEISSSNLTIYGEASQFPDAKHKQMGGQLTFIVDEVEVFSIHKTR